MPGDIRLALSIRQPYVEEIMQGTKRIEYRTIPTTIRGTVFIYASLEAGDEQGFAKLKKQVGDLPTGHVVGTVEITGCALRNGRYEMASLQSEAATQAGQAPTTPSAGVVPAVLS